MPHPLEPTNRCNNNLPKFAGPDVTLQPASCTELLLQRARRRANPSRASLLGQQPHHKSPGGRKKAAEAYLRRPGTFPNIGPTREPPSRERERERQCPRDYIGSAAHSSSDAAAASLCLSPPKFPGAPVNYCLRISFRQRVFKCPKVFPDPRARPAFHFKRRRASTPPPFFCIFLPSGWPTPGTVNILPCFLAYTSRSRDWCGVDVSSGELLLRPGRGVDLSRVGLGLPAECAGFPGADLI